ncbi:hypothetical protein MBLNU459_g5746t1 [Dothideomycetes sp. NU459]
MSIHALPQAAVRAIGSSQALTDPASVAKELIDNALDARATSVSIEISSNTLDVIQVRDNGHGIAPDDRPLVARRYCTSKIRNEKDLASIGGSSLGFRGEALSSAVEMSGGMIITTRVEGDGIATALEISQDGEIAAQDPASHPVGTTVRITDFLARHPVRKQVALKGTVKTLAKIKQTLQAYAFARPATRFSLRVLKAKNDRDNWTYAPKPDGGIEDAALKVVGKSCVSHCAHILLNPDGFALSAYLPRPGADAAKISNFGQFLSVDNRPVTSLRGTPKQIVKMFKETLKRYDVSMQEANNPFLYLSISCPSNSYDANIEPAKDDVLFEDPDKVLNAVRALLAEAYPMPIERQSSLSPMYDLPQRQQSQSIRMDKDDDTLLVDPRPKRVRTVKHNMYDLDDDDLALFTDATQQPEMLAEDEKLPSSEASTSSNPWIMARMHASMRRKPNYEQLVTPAKQPWSPEVLSSSPVREARPSRQLRSHLPSPKPSSPVKAGEQSLLLVGSHFNSIVEVSPRSPYLDDNPAPIATRPANLSPVSNGRNESEVRYGDQICDGRLYEEQPYKPVSVHPSPHATEYGTPLISIPEVVPRQRGPRRQEQQQRSVNKPFKPPANRQQDMGLDPVVMGRFGPSTQRHSSQRSAGPKPVSSREPIVAFDQAQFLTPSSVNNRDIRNFLVPDAPHTVGSSDINQHEDEDSLPANGNVRPSQSPEPVLVLSSINDFVPASRLSLNTPVQEGQTERQLDCRSRLRRRRTSERRVLRETTGNGAVSDFNFSNSADEAQHRRTIDVGSSRVLRTKSAKLPLEELAVALRVHNVFVVAPVTTAGVLRELDHLQAEGSFMAWNAPAIGCDSAFEKVSDADTVLWASSLQTLLEKRFQGEMVLNLLGLVREAVTFRDEPPASGVISV